MTHPPTTANPESAIWPVRRLNPNPHNPRGHLNESGLAELAESIKSQGVLQPLLVTPLGLVVAGHRRLAAAKLAGLEEVPVLVRELSVSEQQEIMLVENLQREDLTLIEEAHAFKRLLDSGMTSVALGRKLGLSVNRISSRLLLLKLDEQVQAMYARGDLPINLAVSLLKITDPARQRQIATRACQQQLTVAELEEIIEQSGSRRATPPGPPPVTAPSMPPARITDDVEPPEPERPVVSRGRQATMDCMAAKGDVRFSMDELRAAFASVCCACGMQDLPKYCAECPMVQLVDVLLDKAS